MGKYPQQVLDIIGYFHDAMPAGHQFEKLLAAPAIPTAPEIWLLGSSCESARIAAMLGTSYAFAEFFGTPGGEEATQYYNEHFVPKQPLEGHPRSMIATLAICAETEEEANRLAMSSDLLFLGIRTDLEMQFLPSVQTATNYPYREMDLIER